MDYKAIWSEIEADPSTEGSVVRRVLPHLKHDAHLGVELPGHERFLHLHLVGATLGHVPSRLPRMRRLDVAVVLETPRKASIQLRETGGTKTSQFEDVVADVLELLETLPGDGAAARIVERVIAWQEFFALRDAPFGTEAAAGLFAELSVLKSLITPKLGASRAIGHWTGPDRRLQDFQFTKGAIEVKSYRGSGSGRLRISSERQLDTTGAGQLFLAYVELDEREDGIGSTIHDTVDTIREMVSSSPHAEAQFAEKLLRYGWRESLTEFRAERYDVRRMELFEVSDGFPRLIPSMLPVGVGRVEYDIDRSALSRFHVSTEQMFARLEMTDE